MVKPDVFYVALTKPEVNLTFPLSKYMFLGDISRKMSFKRISFICLFLLFLSFFSFAQRDVGTFVGTVYDPDGLPLPGVSVTARNVQTGLTQATVCNNQGRYRIERLPRGEYALTASLEGFNTLTKEKLELYSGAELRVDFTLEVGRLEVEITVIGETPMIETTRSQVSTIITGKEILSYPQGNRNYLTLMQYAPGTQPAEGFWGDSFAVNGLRGEMNNYMIDGLDNNDMTENVASRISTLPPESIQEIRLISNNFSAEYGRNVGGILNVVMKSGTNELHGSSWLFYRGDNALFRSADWLTHERQPYERYQFGGTLGGPVIKDKTFFFLSFERLDQEISDVEPWFFFTPETIAKAQGTARQMFDKYGSLYEKPTYDFRDADGDGIYDYGRAPFKYSNANKAYTFGIKIDHIFNERDRVAIRWLYNNSEEIIGNYENYLPGKPWVEPKNSSIGGLTWLHLFGPTAYNELRLGVRLDNWYWNPRDSDISMFSWWFDEVQSIGDAGYVMAQNNKTYQLVDVLNFQMGDHSFKVGGEFRHWTVFTRFDAIANGWWFYLNALDWIQNKGAYLVGFGTDPPDPPANNPYILGDPQGEWKTGVGLTDRNWRGYEIALFAQDDWRVSDRLTVSLGLRWDYFSVPEETTVGINQPAFGTKQGYENTINGNLDITEGKFNEEGIKYLIFDGRQLMGKGLWNPYYYNFAPKISFAYDLTGDGKTSLRGGVGIAYERQMNLGYESERFNYPDLTLINFEGHYHGNPPLIATMPGQIPMANVSSFKAKLNWMLPDDMKPQMAWNWLLGIQRELAPNFSIEIDYSGTEGRRIGHINNRMRYTGDGLDDVIDGLNPYCDLLQVNMRENRKFSRYHGLSIILNKRFSNGWSWYTAYTFSQAKNHSDFFQGGRTVSTERDDMEYGLAGYDHRHRLVGGIVYDLPFFKESESWFMKNIVAGWQVATSFHVTSGSHFDIYTSNVAQDWNLDGIYFDRPLYKGNKAEDVIQWEVGRPGLDTSLFGAPDPPEFQGTPGNRWETYDKSYYEQNFTFRNQFTWFPTWNIDLSLQKYFILPVAGRDVTLQLIGEVFNLLKSQFWEFPETNMNSAIFGTVARMQGERIAQFSVRVMF